MKNFQRNMTVLIIALCVIFMIIAFSSCADSKSFVDNKGQTFTAEPYGWADEDELKIDTVRYKPCVGNIVWGYTFI